MSDDVVEFFEELGRRGHEPLLAKMTGRVRFDLVDGDRTDRWLVAVDKGDTVVSHQDGLAECTIRAERALFERLCRGEENAMAAMLRGALVCTGDVELLYAIQRIFANARQCAARRTHDDRKPGQDPRWQHLCGER